MILIRADANKEIGSGHIMRCLTLASAFVDAGEKVLFITADHCADSLIQNRGYESVCMETVWTKMDSEIPKLISIIKDYNPLFLLVDSYYATVDYFKQLNGIVKTVYFDDLNDSIRNVDTLINYNIYGTVLDYSKYSEKETSLLLGPSFAPLRREFRNLDRFFIKNSVTDILVSAGGSDPHNVSEIIMSHICPQFKNIRFHVLVGSLNNRLEFLKSLETDNVVLHIDEKKMCNLIHQCDIAISAAGVTLYELCACGIPTITYTLADNQLLGAGEFSRQGLMIYVGDSREGYDFIEPLERELSRLIADKELRKKMSIKMQEVVDGNGVNRLVDMIVNAHEK